jgi:hypothetical protein
MRLFGFFRKRFDPRIGLIKDALKELDLFFEREIAWDEIRRVIEIELSKPLDANIQFEKPKHPHRFLTKVLWFYVTDELRSGRLHIYRGVLSGRGKSYRSIAEDLASHMTAYGDFRGSQNDEELEALDTDISEVG